MHALRLFGILIDSFYLPRRSWEEAQKLGSSARTLQPPKLMNVGVVDAAADLAFHRFNGLLVLVMAVGCARWEFGATTPLHQTLWETPLQE